jgi:hypothetical protein
MRDENSKKSKVCENANKKIFGFYDAFMLSLIANSMCVCLLLLKLSWPKTLVKKWFNIKSKAEEFQADDVLYGGDYWSYILLLDWIWGILAIYIQETCPLSWIWIWILLDPEYFALFLLLHHYLFFYNKNVFGLMGSGSHLQFKICQFVPFLP